MDANPKNESRTRSSGVAVTGLFVMAVMGGCRTEHATQPGQAPASTDDPGMKRTAERLAELKLDVQMKLIAAPYEIPRP